MGTRSDPLIGLVLALVGIGILDVADRMRATPPATTTNAPRPGLASAGLPDDGHSATYAPVVDVWAAGGFLDESSRAARRAGGARPVAVTTAVADTAPLIDRARATWGTGFDYLGVGLTE